MLLIVAESSGSSPGRAGYKMAVADDGELRGSVGGGAMEVQLVEQAKEMLAAPPVGDSRSALREQVHRKDVPNSSGMICSGRQTVILKQLTEADLSTVERIHDAVTQGQNQLLNISRQGFSITPPEGGTQNCLRSVKIIPPSDFLIQLTSASTKLARDRMLFKPRPLPGDKLSGSNPRPSSSNVISSPRVSVTVTLNLT